MISIMKKLVAWRPKRWRLLQKSRRGTGNGLKERGRAGHSTPAACTHRASSCHVALVAMPTCAIGTWPTVSSAPHRIILALLAITRCVAATNDEVVPADSSSELAVPLGWRELSHKYGACALPGMALDFEAFVGCMSPAVETGFVDKGHARFVAEGLRHGFDLGVDTSALRGGRIFRNYESATNAAAREAVSKAINERAWQRRR